MMASLDRIREALQFIDASDRETWLRMGMAIKSELADTGFDLWEAWSQQAESFNAKDARDVWKSIRAGGKVTIGTLFYEAKANGWRDDGNYQAPTARELAERRRIAADLTAMMKVQTARQHLAMAEIARSRWDGGVPADPAHGYPKAKRVGTHNLRQFQQTLLVPLLDMRGTLWSLQTIGPDGLKLFAKGSRVGGLFSPIGDPHDAHTLLICEGWATGATLHEDSGHPVLCAMNAGNLLSVARQARAAWPDADIIIAADNDRFTPGNPGLTKATEAAKATHSKLIVPRFPDDSPGTDYNDLRILREGVNHA